MITNREKLEQLNVHVKRLIVLIEEISERDIYPVSFFSQAYDMTNTIQDELRKIEITQIELFEKQMKEHQAQILSIIPPTEKPGKQGESDKKEMLTESSEHVQELLPQTHPDGIPQNPFKEEVLGPLPQTPLQQETDTPAIIPSPISPTKNYPAGEINRIDLKKVITLNDRFLFCRELFSNDENLMNRTITDLNKETSLETSMEYVERHFDWNIEEGYAADFIACVKKSFGN